MRSFGANWRVRPPLLSKSMVNICVKTAGAHEQPSGKRNVEIKEVGDNNTGVQTQQPREREAILRVLRLNVYGVEFNSPSYAGIIGWWLRWPYCYTPL